MTLFLIGLAILLGGGYVYSQIVEKMFGPDDSRETPAIAMADGVDFVAMPKWKNMLINLLNIAGTGPVIGPIQGILFGPIAFITIPIGCVIAGVTHDYFVGMISARNKGAQMPRLVQKFIGKGTNVFYNIVNWALLLLVGVVFIYTPGDLIVNDLLGLDVNGNVIYYVYAAILLYYIVSTVFPIDQIIGRVYPIFGAVLIIGALGVLYGIFFKDGGANLNNFGKIGDLGAGLLTKHPKGQYFIPAFFITVSCGIMSGFHGSQVPLISRTINKESEGKFAFSYMMILEGLIAMAWAGGAMVLYNKLGSAEIAPTLMVGHVAKEFMGTVGGAIAVCSVIVLPITSGDTAFRALRLMVAEQFNIDQSSAPKRIGLSIAIFIPATAILVWAKTDANGFNTLWRYFGFTNQFTGVFALLLMTVYLKAYGKNYYIPMLVGMFYTFIVMSFISHADIGFKLDSLLGIEGYTASYAVGAVCALFFAWFVTHVVKTKKDHIVSVDGK